MTDKYNTVYVLMLHKVEHFADEEAIKDFQETALEEGYYPDLNGFTEMLIDSESIAGMESGEPVLIKVFDENFDEEFKLNYSALIKAYNLKNKLL